MGSIKDNIKATVVVAGVYILVKKILGSPEKHMVWELLRSCTDPGLTVKLIVTAGHITLKALPEEAERA
ncbi:hypothetical protein Ct61P_01691 [Colletotrichum tofieldiae]|nr:hypothetical protein Ct61P_01691 [Colletotrichum tofieldiae]